MFDDYRNIQPKISKLYIMLNILLIQLESITIRHWVQYLSEKQAYFFVSVFIGPSCIYIITICFNGCEIIMG